MRETVPYNADIQKVVEVAPSIGLPQKVVDELCQAGVELARKSVMIMQVR